MNYIKITDDNSILTSELYKRIKDKFGAWSYWNEEELDKHFPVPKKTTTRYFPEQAESSDRKGESWNQMKDVHKDMMTLREYILFFIVYHEKTGDYPDKNGFTLFQDRLPSGGVASGDWDPDPDFRGVRFGWGWPGSSYSSVGARLAMSPEPSNLVPSAIHKCPECNATITITLS